MKWFPLCNYTHYSLQKAFSKPKQLAKKCAKNSYPACGIADYQSISGAVSFYQACVANDVKPIIGCAFDGFTLFAKNKAGWLELIRIVSTVDDEGSVNKALLVKLANNGNMICVAKDEALSPVSGKDFYVKTEAFSDTYYAEKEHSELHRVLLCSGMKTTLPQIKRSLNSRQQIDNQEFFECNDYYLKDRAETAAMLINDPQMEVFDEIFNKIENYNILNRPILPNFVTPDGLTQKEYLRLLIEDAWSKMEDSVNEQDLQVYRDRIEREFGVIEGADLFGYFLVVRDIIDHCHSQGWMVGPGRGSAAGCLISFLIGITQIDPILYNLLFERFYNAGRNTVDHVSLPDIDIDVPSGKRDAIILYLKDKYGHSNVSQMCTFGRLQGRSAIKEVMRVNNACGFGEMNEITKYIPDEAAVSDQLAEMDEEDRSIIRWALLNNADELRDYCYIDEDGQLRGDYAEYFQQAIDIEGTFKTQGKHAAGVVISAEPLYEVCPMINQKSGGEKIAGLEMNDLEALGHVKFDVLALSLLDKLMYIEELLGKGVDK
jgi:DNA polymerase III subunit alpha